jgi:uncharacterized protein (TIGR02646 family)
MIKLTKGAEPQVLADNKTSWRDTLLGFIARKEKIPHSVSSKYNHPDVKDALRSECNSKCMYCESLVEHISDLHIEHIRPKAPNKYPNLTFEFENLGLACGVCNRNKSDDFDESNTFINPYLEDPASHFHVCGPFIFANAGNKRAKITELTIELNRADLFEQRSERIKTLRKLIDEYDTETNMALKNAIKKEILKEVSSGKIYSFCTTAYVKNRVN